VDELVLRLRNRLAILLDMRPSRLSFSVLSSAKVPDGTTAVRIGDAPDRSRAVLLLSTLAHPDAIAIQMKRTRQIKAALDHATGSPILEPLQEGRVRGLSYAVMPYCRSLGHVWPHRALQRAALLPALLEWLRSAKQQSISAVRPHETELRFAKPLRHVTAETALDPRIRQAANAALARLERGDWVPRHALMHGDLWHGNVMLRSRERSRRWRTSHRHFAVIDWGGAELQGYGIYDLLRLAQSFRLGENRLWHEIGRLCQMLHCDRIDAKSHLLSALGHIGMYHECLPLHHYAHLAKACFETLERAERDAPRRFNFQRPLAARREP
jgi:hypothetical protein